MHYFNDKPCFLIMKFAHYTLCQNKIDSMLKKSMFERSVINKMWRPGINPKISGKKKKFRKYIQISMFIILKTSLSLKMSNAYISNDMIIMFIILSIV